jgi:acyl-CoA reductase-like NAD-dependent aldehyde dehydrogenase
VQRYRDLQAVFDAISASPYGLQCGIFTRSIETGLRAVRSLRVGGVIINGTSTWRTDQMPYGGIKASGIGREGPRYAMRDMTEERFVLFNF